MTHAGSIQMLCALWLVWPAVWLALPPSSLATVSCRTACVKCSERTEHQALLEVYCAMCHECRERRRAWRHFSPRKKKSEAKPGQRANSEDEFPDEPKCPEPPPCDSEVEEIPDQLMSSPPELVVTTPPAAPTPAPPLCHEHPPCHPQGGAPCCLPFCPYPTQPCVVDHSPQKMTIPDPTTAATQPEYFYIHVGVPKDILNNM